MTGDALQNIEQIEFSFWKAADQLRANSKLTSSEYTMPVLGVIFLRHAANRLYAAKAAIEADQAAGKMPKHPLVKADFVLGTHEKPLVKGPGIIVGRKGNFGSIYWSSCDFYPTDTVYFVDAETSDRYLYYALQHMYFISTDVAVPGLNRDFAYSRKLVVPIRSLHREFLVAVSPLHEIMEKLDGMNDKLRAAWDLLLTRLMSGEIAV